MTIKLRDDKCARKWHATKLDSCYVDPEINIGHNLQFSHLIKVRTVAVRMLFGIRMLLLIAKQGTYKGVYFGSRYEQ